MCAWSQRLWGFSVLPFLLPFFILLLLLLLSTRIFVSSSPESLGSRDPPWPPQSSGDQPLGPALRGQHGNSSGSCGSRTPLLLASSSAAAGVTELSSSSVTSAARTVEDYGPSPPVSSYYDLSSSEAATTQSATRGESTSPPPPTSLSRGHEFSSIAELSPSRPRRRRAVYARGHGQATAYGTGPGRWHRKPLGWGDFSASVRTARLQLLVMAKMVDQGNGSLSVHFWHNATGREGNLSISLGPHAIPLRFSTRGPLASQQPRFHQQQQQQHRQHHHQQQQQQHRQHQHGQQQHHQYQHQQQPRHQQQWNENYQRHHEDDQHPKQQQHQHDQNNRQQQQQWNEKQLQLKQERHQQHPQQQQAESKESQDTGTFHCRVEYEKVDRALKRAPCAEPRVVVSPAAGSSPSPGGPGHGPPGVGSGTGGLCYREQVQSHVSWICSKPISAFCIFIAFQDEDYRLAHKVCPDLHAARNPPSG